MADVAVAGQVQVGMVVLRLGNFADALEEVKGGQEVLDAPLAADALAVRRQPPVRHGRQEIRRPRRRSGPARRPRRACNVSGSIRSPRRSWLSPPYPEGAGKVILGMFAPPRPAATTQQCGKAGAAGGKSDVRLVRIAVMPEPIRRRGRCRDNGTPDGHCGGALVRRLAWAAALTMLMSSAACAQRCVLPRPFELDRINRQIAGHIVDYTHNHGRNNAIWSPALCERRDLYVYLPPCYDPCKQYPLILWLHGFGQDEHSFLDGRRPAARPGHAHRTVAAGHRRRPGRQPQGRQRPHERRQLLDQHAGRRALRGLPDAATCGTSCSPTTRSGRSARPTPSPACRWAAAARSTRPSSTPTASARWWPSSRR